MPTSPWHKLLDSPEESHIVQFYGADEELLISHVAQFLSEGLKRGEGGTVIATPEHLRAFMNRLNVGLRGRIEWLNPAEALAGFMSGGMPDWDRFQRTIVPALQRARRKSERVRAYDEMVGILWKLGQTHAAVRLEQFWNRLLSRSSFHLFCGHSIDIFGGQFHPHNVDALLCAHTHVLPGATGELERALSRAIEEVAGPKADAMEAGMKSGRFWPRWGILPPPEGLILWLRRQFPDQADEIVRRAREYCAESLEEAVGARYS